MKNRLLGILIFLFISIPFYSQNIIMVADLERQTEIYEPEFINQVNAIVNDKVIPLQIEKTEISSKASASFYLVGAGVVKTRLRMEGSESKTQFNEKNIDLVINIGQNMVNPQTIFTIVKLEQTKKRRQTVIGKIGTFSGYQANVKENVISFEAKKYGKVSTIISLKNLENGEYAIINNNDKINCYTFGIKAK